MKAKARKTTNLVIGAMLVIAALAAGFWILLLSPKRDEAGELATRAEALEASLSQHQAEAETAETARRSFPVDYQRLVVLGKAVPGDDETASLLVQLNGIANRAGVRLEALQLESGAGGEAAPPPTEAGAATEAAASLLPLGATVGPAGLAVMPYTITFEGDFFKVADFIHGLDSLVKTTNERVAVDGRLITVDGFSLQPPSDGSFPRLQASFNVTTYLTPPGQGVSAGASPAGPEGTSTLASASVGAAP
ncbi:MAG TPA: hypothetical protein VHA54_03575 [Solirubrobacterales bacterium]|nr:hypothetical protein [Solirubrobacterales bacterium]